MHLSKQQQKNQDRQRTSMWFECVFHHGVLMCQLGMNQFTEDDVEQIARRLNGARLEGVIDVSNCGVVLTYETAILQSEYKQALRHGRLTYLFNEVLRPATADAIQRVCPHKPQATWFNPDQKKAHIDRYAHKRPGAVIAIA